VDGETARVGVPDPCWDPGVAIRAFPQDAQNTLPVGFIVPQEGHWICACIGVPPEMLLWGYYTLKM